MALLGLLPVTSVHSQELLWQSRNNSLTELSAEFGNFYSALIALRERGASIPVRTYKDVEGRYVADIAKSAGLYAGSYFPKQLDHLLCSLNPSICRMQAQGEVVGYVWSNTKGSEIVLPDIHFESTIFPRPYRKRRGDSLERIVIVERQGCQSYDQACERFLNNLNRAVPNFSDPDFQGDILVPTKIYRTRLELPDPEGASFEEQQVPASADVQPSMPPTGNPLWVGSTADLEKGLEGFATSLVPSAKIKSEGHEGATDGAVGAIAKVRQLVSVPSAVRFRQSAPVGIVDRHVYKDHCDFTDMLTVVRAGDDGVSALDRTERVLRAGRPDGTPNPPECLSNGRAIKARDHGTHIAGLISARHMGLLGEEGASSLRSFAFELPSTGLSDAVQVAAIADTIAGSFRDAQIYVMNLSLQYPLLGTGGDNDPIEELLRNVAQYSTTLFVVAAGNDSKQFGRGSPCPIRPACFKFDNIISVVALDLDNANPAVLGDSNRGEAFDIAAPGLNIESTISGHRLGLMSGTSQATALVSSAAALLFSENRRLESWEVRARMIYTADHLPSLVGKVFGGRLNVARALNLDATRITLSEEIPSLPRTLEGELVESSGECIRFTDIDSGVEVSATPSRIKRLTKVGNDVYRLFVSGAGCRVHSRKAEALRKHNVTITNAESCIRIKREVGGSLSVTKVPIRYIADYVSEL